MSELSIVMCGRGRVGGALAKKLELAGYPVSGARLTQADGLKTVGKAQISSIQLLVICISARQKSGQPVFDWAEILDGLQRQVEAGLLINNLLFVSSTRVYEGYASGLVKAASLPKATSTAGNSLITAEKIALKLATRIRLLRASGLYGDLYPLYTPIMRAAKDKPRFGVDAHLLVERLFKLSELAMNNRLHSGAELITDGNLYYQNEVMVADSETRKLLALSEEHRILINSQTDFQA